MAYGYKKPTHPGHKPQTPAHKPTTPAHKTARKQRPNKGRKLEARLAGKEM